MRVKITVSYDGSKFFGFQIQPNNKKTPTVVGELIKAFKSVGIDSVPIGSGRTDAGVHAFGQVFHIDLPPFWSDFSKLLEMLNRKLHPSIHLKNIKIVQKDFHSRFSAKKRLYRYFIYTGDFNPFYSAYALHVKDLDLSKMKSILKNFEGSHDFGYFKKEGSATKSDMRIIYKTSAYRHQNFLVVTFLGNSFLRSQVRMMVSFALKIAQGKLTQEDLKAQLTLQRVSSRSLVESNALFLSKIYY